MCILGVKFEKYIKNTNDFGTVLNISHRFNLCRGDNWGKLADWFPAVSYHLEWCIST